MANHEEQTLKLENMSPNELKEFELKLKNKIEEAKFCRDAELNRRENNLKILHQLQMTSKAECLEIDKLESYVTGLNRRNKYLVKHIRALSRHLNHLQDESMPELMDDPEMSIDNSVLTQLNEDLQKWKEDFNVENIQAQTQLAIQSKEFFMKEQEKVKQRFEIVQKQITEFELHPSASTNVVEVIDDYNKYSKANCEDQLKKFEESVTKCEKERNFHKNLLLMSQGFDIVDPSKYGNDDTSDSDIEI